MTIIFDNGEFWIEYIRLSVTLQDAAGDYTASAVNLAREGHYMGMGSTPTDGGNNDNARNCGLIEISINGFAAPTIGDTVSNLRAVIHKAVGTGGALVIPIDIVIFLRK